MNIRRFFSRKKIIWTLIILAVIGGVWYYVAKNKKPAGNIQTAVVARQDLKQTVLTTGQVVSAVNLNLSFQGSGVVNQVNAVAGNPVKAGDVLAVLNQANAQAALTSAQGVLAQANANYRRIVSGATADQINVSQKAVNSAQVSYNNAVAQLASVEQSTSATISQAQSTLDDLQSPTTQADNKRSAILVTISSQLTTVQASLDKENQILSDNNLKNTFSVLNASSLSSFQSSYAQTQPLLATANASLAAAQGYKSDANINQAVADSLSALTQSVATLNYCLSALQNSVASSVFGTAQLDAYKSAVNTQITTQNSGITAVRSAKQALSDALTASQNAVTNANLSATQQKTAVQNQINSAHAALQQAQAALTQLQSHAQAADIEAARAQILSAQGQVDAATANLNNTILKAPVDGTVTQVDTKVGQQANAMQEVIIIQDINALHAEAYVSESDVANLQAGQPVDYTFDALGPDKHFSGKVLTINPASTVISGVVDYLVKADFPNIPEIKPGMTANMTILVAEKKGVLAIPSGAIVNRSEKRYVKVIDDPKKKTYHEVEVTTGLEADGGFTEVLSGLTEGQEIVTYIK